ncbi:tRNA (adenosine(37)-N6)-threonylcarbamoyltransferase complex ATPase subunit type 1 TsaE [Alicyclobacillus mengziensis]|nr:tRNA (adenosine(37)-N6)-threonylcarbamoyltransferase complex ATPase subunit type 1 TsaE [Alicyclobacillus mengziensis]
MNEMAFTTRSAAETFRLGRQLGALLQAGDVVFLTGHLGSGKTTFAKGVAQGLGVQADVTSPTFTLVSEYEGRVPLAHMDLYRLLKDTEGTTEPTTAVDFAAIGVQDYLYGDYAVLVEWPGALVEEVDDALFVDIVQPGAPKVDEREFRCKATGEKSWKRLDEWVKQWLF